MKSFEKKYIGKGKQVNDFEIIRVTCKLDELVKHAYLYQGVEYVTFEVAKLQNPDLYGKTHTVYMNVPVENVSTSDVEEKDNSGEKSDNESHESLAKKYNLTLASEETLNSILVSDSEDFYPEDYLPDEEA